MLRETIKKTRMYSGITQTEMAKQLFMSDAQYSRKENGLTKITLREARKIAKILDIDEKIAEKFWMADHLYDMMKNNRDHFYEALKIVEMYYDNYESCVEIPNKNCSYSSLRERMSSKKKK